MTIRSGFFRSIGNDRPYTAEFFRSYFSSFIGNGVFPNPSTNLQVLAFQSFQTKVSAGKGWIDGAYIFNDDALTINHNAPDGVLSRIDRIVFSLNLDTRTMDIYLKQGANSSNPVAPVLIRNASLIEYALADVLIAPGSTSITQANITDLRSNSALCGYVAGLVQQIDTTTLFNQYQTAQNDFITTSRQEFEDYIEGLQDLLDGDIAANLASRIIALEGNTQKSTQAQAQAGTDNNTVMTPLRTDEARRFKTTTTFNDFNLIINNGSYSLPGETIINNIPSDFNRFGTSHLMVNNNTGNTLPYQILMQPASGRIWSRSRQGGTQASPWSTWLRLDNLDVGDLSALQTTAKSSTVAAINETFQLANNIKTRWANVVGAPLVNTDTQAQLETKTQTIKSKLATYNTNKGQASVNTETLDSLVEKVNLIQTVSPTASGTVLSSSTSSSYTTISGESVSYFSILVNGLTFTPRKIILFYNNNSTYSETIYDVDRNNLLGITLSAYSSGLANNTNANVSKTSSNVIVNNQSFRLPVSVQSANYSWIAVG